MKYALLNIKRISAPVVLLASVLAFCGCINDSESPCDVENVREVTMNFRLAIQREAAKRRVPLSKLTSREQRPKIL